MHLSLNRPSSWSFLLLLASSLLLCQDVVSLPVDAAEHGKYNVEFELEDNSGSGDYVVTPAFTTVKEDEASLQNLLDSVVDSSQYTMNASSDLAIMFIDQYNAQGKLSELPFPECSTGNMNPTEAQGAELTEVLDLLFSILGAWKEPLHHVGSEMGNVPGAAVVSDVETKFTEMQENLTKVLNKVQPGAEVKHSPAVWWTNKESLQSEDEDSVILALYNMSRCMYWDSFKIETFAKIVRCRMVPSNDC